VVTTPKTNPMIAQLIAAATAPVHATMAPIDPLTLLHRSHPPGLKRPGDIIVRFVSVTVKLNIILLS
jgi:hypothetical protein